MTLASDIDGQGRQCMRCDITIHICAWKVSISLALACKPISHAKGNHAGEQGKAEARLRKNVWCMTCKDAAATQLVRLVSKDSILKATRVMANTDLLHVPSSVLEVSVSPALSSIHQT